MADSLICNTEPKISADGYSDTTTTPSNGSLFQRRIEFHQARKPFLGIGGGGDFRLETLNPSSSEPQRSGANPGLSSVLKGKKSDGSDFFENGLDPELSFGITFRRIGAGLENLGNTCFLNSVLQCLTYTEPLAAYLQSGKHQTSCHVAGFCALCAIQKHVSRALQSTGRILAPKDLVSNLRCISRNFRNARQEDAHEYMVNLLESMHKCCLPSGVPTESPSAYEKSLVHKIFGGRLRSQVKCMQCSYCSNTFDPFLDLSLEIVKADSLHKALVHFTATEQLDGGERQYQCQRCKQKVKALKQLTVHKAPYVLTVHLKRFRSIDPGQKIDKKVHFGPTLDLKPFVSGSYEGDLKYTLYGVLVHAGWSTHSGHYYCFVRTSSGMWYSLDDNRVVQVNERTVLEQKAYMLFYVRDKRNITPKKPVAVVQKENMVANALGNKMLSKSNQGLKGTVQNGLVEKRFSGDDTSSAATQREALNVGSSKEILLKEASVQKVNGPTIAECMALKKDPQLESSSNVPLVKDPVKGLYVLNSKIGECLPLSGPSVQGSGETPHLDNATVARTAAKINDCNGGSSKKDLIPPNCNGHQNPAANMLVRDNTSQKINIVSNMGVLSIAPTKDPSDKTSDKVDLIRSPNQQNSEHGQVGGIPNGSVAGDSPTEKASDSCLKVSVNGSVELSCSSIMTKETLRLKDHKPHQKSKKKIPKCRVATMHLGPNILFGASLSLRKKKKHKRSKRRSLEIKNLNQENLLSEADMGPSTSELTRTVSLASTHSERKRVKSGSKNWHNGNAVKEVGNSNGNSLMDLTNGEFKGRVGQNGVVLATDMRPEKSCSSSSSLTVKLCDAREPEISKERKIDSMQNGLMSMLTRGLEEALVARWDGIESPPFRNIEPSIAGNFSIGYIPDEWDEEYDRGKRKKVRSSKNSFGGPNPFQEIATRKAQIKKAKMDQSSSGNRPFRI